MKVNSYASGIIARDQAKFEKTPAIKKAAQKTAKAALTDEFVAQIKEHAKKDAQVNIYMQDDYVKMVNAQKQQKVSPNRQEAISKATFAMNSAVKGGGDLFSMLLGGYSMKAWMGMITTAEVYAPNGEMIAGFNSNGCGWTEIPTEAEYQFMSQTNQIYREAYDAARAEIKAAAEQRHAAADGGATASFDVRA